MNIKHYKSLQNMYLAAPVNQYYRPSIEVSKGQAEITMDLQESMHHSAGMVHGSVYFKMLDDAAFFAANSLEEEFFVLTSSFTVYLTRPMSLGSVTAIGKVVNQSRTQWIVESIVYYKEKEVARGSGVFVKSKLQLLGADGYHINDGN